MTYIQPGDTVWRAYAGTAYSINFGDPGSGVLKIQYRFTNVTGVILKDWTDIATSINAAAYATPWTVDFSKLEEGVNNVSVRAYDVGNFVNTLNNAFFIRKDSIPPGYPKIQPAGPMAAKTISVNVTYSDVSPIVVTPKPFFCWVGGGVESCEPPINQQFTNSNFISSPATDGVYTLCTKATNAAGLTSDIYCNGTFVKDGVNPIINQVSISPISPIAEDTVTITAIASDALSGVDKINITIDGVQIGFCQGATSCSGSFQITKTVDYEVKVSDKAGNWATPSSTGTIIIDSLPPSYVKITPLGSGSPSDYKTLLSINLQCSDDVECASSTCELVNSTGQVPAGTDGSWSWTLSRPSPSSGTQQIGISGFEGAYYLKCNYNGTDVNMFKDTKGNLNNSLMYHGQYDLNHPYYIDKKVPVTTLNYNPSTKSFTLTCSDGASGCQETRYYMTSGICPGYSAMTKYNAGETIYVKCGADSCNVCYGSKDWNENQKIGIPDSQSFAADTNPPVITP
jgi:hypothetical protein